jgi:hypothetical protein
MDWYELRPFKIQEEHNAVNGLQEIMDHISHFLLVISRDTEGKIRTFIKIPPFAISSLDVIDGIETVHINNKITLTDHKYHNMYKTRRHCAIPIADNNTIRSSIHKIMDSDVSGPAYLALHALKIQSTNMINEYIRDVEQGTPTEGVSKVLYGIFGSNSSRKTKNLSPLKASKIAQARLKLMTRHLFRCELFCGANDKDNIKMIESVFPSMAFIGKSIQKNKVFKMTTSRPKIPTSSMFGGARLPLLTDVEILSFYGLPEKTDIDTVNLEAGSLRSHSSGLRGEDVDFATLNVSQTGDVSKDDTDSMVKDASCDTIKDNESTTNS